MASYTLHASATETASGVGPSTPIDVNSLVGIFTNISASSGTLPTLTVKLQQTPNGTDWYDVSSMTSNTLNSPGLSNLQPNTNGEKIGDEVRCAWTIGGVNPSFTFDVELIVVP